MWDRLRSLPVLLLLMGVAALAMLVPAAHALTLQDHAIARSFFYAALLLFFVTALIAVALRPRRGGMSPREQLLTIFATFTLLPVFLAVPFHHAVGNTSFLNAWFEMVSSLTTTGATLFDTPGRLPTTLHLWRGLVGWLGGFFIWVAAIALLAPMNLGGFEVTNAADPGAGMSGLKRQRGVLDAFGRLSRATRGFAPIYAVLTLALWVLLLISGEPSLPALVDAMSTLATSGISMGDKTPGPDGLGGEAVVFFFMFFGVTRLVHGAETSGSLPYRVAIDPEFRLAIALLILIPSLLFLRHWVGAYEVEEYQDASAGLRALWGGLFTTLSFLTTTGFVSAEWDTASNWSGLPASGVLLSGLCLIGGGVATTAGGVKLLRVYALFRHGQRELERLVHPSSVAGTTGTSNFLRRHGAYAAWIAFMLIALSICVIVLGLSIMGVPLDSAMMLAISALSNTGPLAPVATNETLTYAALGPGAKLLLAAGMVFGRLEALAIVALFNPDFWRR
ncbi:potassium transporter TrkG [Poseidonocella sedimentorum]|uniref:Trk system potassium uptake protein TrkH n=1 Tax=Poseidonocella sedimentorum TaxID=871652 RepID=A0A1I6E7W9_9RHOB|nr:potassium transporter TrkG [Poseidonocella sedimentorum]SFR13824.1 trk system potassium uptake protein TrkH [Poseidonocella sedimentorum]